MKRLLSILFALLLTSSLSACLYNANQQDAALKIVNEWNKDFQANDLDAAMSLYDPSFFHDHAKPAWKQKLASILKKYGALKEIHPTFQQKDPRFRGDYYMFGFRLVFEKGSLRETITVFKAIEKDHLSIAGHMFEPVSGNG